MWLFTAQRRIPVLEGADRFAFSAALGAALVRLGNFMNSEIVGREIEGGTWGVWFKKTCETRPDGTFGCWQILGLRPQDWADRCPTGGTDCWGMDESEIYRHPSQLYEVFLGLFVLAALLVFDRVLGKEKRPRGALISLFFVLYFVGRFIVEFFKEYQTDLVQSHMLTMGQWLSIPGVLIGVYGLTWAFRTRLPASWSPKGPPRRKKTVERDDDFDDDFDDDDDDLDDEQRRPARKAKKKTSKKKTKKTASKKKKKTKKRPSSETVEAESSAPSSQSAPKDDDDELDSDDDDDEPGATSRIATAGKRGRRRRARSAETSKKPEPNADEPEADDDREDESEADDDREDEDQD
jgi:prolipoprotein diacylglyceryl transferase